MGYGLVNGFIDYLHIWLGSTSNYSATANLHNLQITITPTKPFPAFCVFTSCSLAMTSNTGDSSASCAQIWSSQTLVQNSCQLSTELQCYLFSASLAELNWPVAPVLFFITPWQGPHRQHPLSPVTWVANAAGMCLPNSCPETGLI
jgi:hypothetical protein